MRALLPLMVCLLLICGCSAGADESEDASGEIMLSNLRTPDMNLTQSEKNTMEQVRKIIEGSLLKRDSSGQDRLHAVNTSDLVLKSVTFYAAFYDQDGVLVKEEKFDVDDWTPGEVVDAPMYSNGIGYSAYYETARLQIEYEDNGVWYRTGQEPVTLEKEDNRSKRTQMSLAGGDSQVITAKDWSGSASYQVTGFSFEPAYEQTSEYYQITVLLRKTAGKITENPGISYRIIRDDGAVCSTGRIYDLTYLEVGETMRVEVGYGYVSLQEGTYTLEIGS